MSTFAKKLKQTFFIFCLLFASTHSLFAQKADSILNLLKDDKEDTTKAMHLANICKEYIGSNEFDKGLVYANQALSLSQKLAFKKGIAQAHYSMGRIYMRQNSYPEALKNTLASLKLREELNDKQGTADAYNNLGTIYNLQGNGSEGLKNFTIALKLFKEVKNKKCEAMAYNNLGIYYAEHSDFTESFKNFNAALKIYEERKDMLGAAQEFSNMGGIYEMLGNYPKAIENQTAALKMAQKIGDINDFAGPLIQLGSLYTELHKTKEAHYYLDSALRIGLRLNSKGDIGLYYGKLTLLDSVEGNYKAAFQHYRLFIVYRDSIDNEETKTESLKIQMQYESEKKEKEIALLNLDLLTKQKDKELLSAQVHQKNNIIIATVASAILLIISVFLFYSRQQLKQKNQYQIEISKQQENTATAIIQTQENERNRIAKDLHDSVGTFLSTLKINLQLLENSIPADKKTTYQNVIELADKTAAELRNITKNISNETLVESGLTDALQELVERVNRLGSVQIDFKTYGISARLKEITEINLYRVAQELITNCVKHAKASKATLQLIAHESNLMLMLEDNGQGIATTSTQKNTDGGMGLKNIRDRINFIKGTLKMESNIGTGTTFIIETPL